MRGTKFASKVNIFSAKLTFLARGINFLLCAARPHNQDFKTILYHGTLYHSCTMVQISRLVHICVVFQLYQGCVPHHIFGNIFHWELKFFHKLLLSCNKLEVDRLCFLDRSTLRNFKHKEIFWCETSQL